MKTIELETIQWSTLTDIDDVAPMSDADYQVLSDIQNVLEKHNYTHRFGVCLLHKHFDLAPGEILMEKTDPEKRVSTLSVEEETNTRSNTIETMWRFGTGIKNVTVCVARCHYQLGHKSRHHREGR